MPYYVDRKEQEGFVRIEIAESPDIYARTHMAYQISCSVYDMDYKTGKVVEPQVSISLLNYNHPMHDPEELRAYARTLNFVADKAEALQAEMREGFRLRKEQWELAMREGPPGKEKEL